MPRTSCLTRLLLLPAVLMAIPFPAAADSVRLTNGQTMEGIVVQQTPTDVRLQIDWQGYTTLNRGIIEAMRLEDRELNQRRLAQWHRDFLALQKRQQDQASFEAAQREKGLVKRGSEWVSVEALALLQNEAAEQERQQLRQQLSELTERIQALEAENRALREEANRPPAIIREFIPAGFLVRHHQPAPERRSLFRDEQGNVVRIRDHGSHQSFTARDGTHVDLQFETGRPVFTDAAGVRHELTPLGH